MKYFAQHIKWVKKILNCCILKGKNLEELPLNWRNGSPKINAKICHECYLKNTNIAKLRRRSLVMMFQVGPDLSMQFSKFCCSSSSKICIFWIAATFWNKTKTSVTFLFFHCVKINKIRNDTYLQKSNWITKMNK